MRSVSMVQEPTTDPQELVTMDVVEAPKEAITSWLCLIRLITSLPLVQKSLPYLVL